MKKKKEENRMILNKGSKIQISQTMRLAVIILIFSVLLKTTYSNSSVPKISNVFVSEAFIITVERQWFPEFTIDDDLEYSASLLDMPDLPNWMFCRHPNASRDAFLYGAAEELGTFQIEIIALNKNNYLTARNIVTLNVDPRGSIALYEVEMKFLNLNVEDMFKSGRFDRLLEVFRNTLWRESEILYITKVVSSLDVGGRLPLNPKEKEGVVVRIGGSSQFSRSLQDLEREVQPLRNRIPCPREYKRTSVEHLFRRRNFIADWCSFRLISGKKDESAGSSREWSNPAYSSIFFQNDDFKPQSLNLPRRDFLFDFIVSIIVPSTVVGMLSTALTCIMCCNRDGLEKKIENETNVQLSQYNPVHCSTNQIQNVSTERDTLHCSSFTPASSLPHSAIGSPTSTLRKSCVTRPSSRTGTLRGLMLPPPPPYTPPSVGSKRSAVSVSVR